MAQVDDMETSYTINVPRLKSAMQALGIRSLPELGKRAAIHRNTIYPLLDGRKSPFSESYLAICRSLAEDPLALLTPASGKDFSHIREVADLCCKEFGANLPGLAIFLFGSRAKGTAKKFSDYDLGVTTGEISLAGALFLRIREFILQRVDDLPVKVDVLNFDAAPASFLLDFDNKMIVIAGNQGSIAFLKGTICGIKKKQEAR